jgi:hypothetical protein
VYNDNDTGSTAKISCDTDCTKLNGYLFLRYIVNSAGKKMCVTNCGDDVGTDFGKKDPAASTDTNDYNKYYFMDAANQGKCIATCGESITTPS